MPDPLLAEFCRSHTLAPEFLRRCQREFRQRLQPRLDQLDVLEERVETLRLENEALAAQLADATTPKKRGRPRKATNTVAEVSA